MLDLINIIRNGPPKRSPEARARVCKPRKPRKPRIPRKPRKPRSTWKAWTDEDESTLREMAGKHPTGEIAKALNRSERAVSQRAHLLDLSLSTRGPDPMTIGMAHVLHKAGYTPAQIINAFNIPTAQAKAIERSLANPQPPK